MLLKVGPRRDQDEAAGERIQRDHLRHLFELEAAGLLTLFGPIEDAGDLRGIGVLTTQTREQAEALMAEDPAVVAGRLRAEIRPWFTRPGGRLPGEAAAPPAIRQLRLVVTADDYDTALAFYRDTLGLRQEAAFAAAGGHVTILDAGRATLELTDPVHAAYIDEVEVGRRVAGHIRVAFEVGDASEATRTLTAAGATLIAPPTRTPWDSLNARLDGPAGLHLTIFEELDAAG
jgi:predicted enzyme related to lactoylglutathione lyase/uncharacterized protein YciI